MTKVDVLVDLYPLEPCVGTGGNRCCIKDIRQGLLSFMAGLGYEQARLVRKTIYKPVVYDSYIGNVPQAWDQEYVREQFSVYDPVSRFTQPGCEEFTPYSDFQEMVDRALDKPLGETPEEQANYIAGVKHYIKRASHYGRTSSVIATNKRGEYLYTLVLSCKATAVKHNRRLTDRFWRELMFGFDVLVRYLEQTEGCNACKEYSLVGQYKDSENHAQKAVDKSLTPDQKTVLILFAKNPGAQIKTIAALRNCGKDNINFHLRQIKKTWGITGNGHSLASYAIKNGYINPTEVDAPA